MAEPSLYVTGGRAGTGYAVVPDKTRVLDDAARERQRMIALDAQNERAQALQRLRAKAQEEELEKSILKPEVDGVGRFTQAYNNDFVLPTSNKMVEMKRQYGKIDRGTAYSLGTQLKAKGTELAAANKAIDDALTQIETTFPQVYDRAQLDQLITGKAYQKFARDKSISSADIQNFAREAASEYHAINRPKVYGDWIANAAKSKNSQKVNFDPTGTNRTLQDFTFNSYYVPEMGKSKSGAPIIKGLNFDASRAFRDQMTDPKLRALYQEQKKMQLADPELKNQYEAEIKEVAAIKDPDLRQRAADKAEFEFFIEPYMGNHKTWATTDMTQEQIAQFIRPEKLTDKERDAIKASTLEPSGFETRLDRGSLGLKGGARGKFLTLSGYLPKDEAESISVGGPGQDVFVINDKGFLEKVENPGLVQGVGQNYQITTENFVRGGLFAMDPKNPGRPLLITKDLFANNQMRKRIKDGFFSKNGFMDGSQYDAVAIDATIQELKKRNLTPVIQTATGTFEPISSASSFFAAGRVKPETFLRLDVAELQEPKSGKKTRSLGVGQTTQAKQPIPNANVFLTTPKLSGTVYIPLTQAQSAGSAIKRNVGKQNFDAAIQKLQLDQDLLNMDEYTNSKESVVPTQTPQQPVKKRKM